MRPDRHPRPIRMRGQAAAPHAPGWDPARKRRYKELKGLGPDGLPYRPKPARARVVALVLSTILALGVFAAYLIQPDALAAVTILPVWAWLLPGLLLLALGLSRASWRQGLIVLALWLAVMALRAEEPRSMLRTSPWPADGWSLALAAGRAARVVSLNCNGGDAAVAREALPYRPTILLLQEAPAREEVESLARQMFGKDAGVAWNGDTAIVAQGPLDVLPVSDAVAPFAVRARVQLSPGIRVEAVSVHLTPPGSSANLLWPGVWSAHAANRRARRAQTSALIAALADGPSDAPLIVGGDMNAQASDAALRPLQARARDAFADAGRGWGNTVLNEQPILRYDQVWASDHFIGGSVTAHRTQLSDHRLVVSDLWLARMPTPR